MTAEQEAAQLRPVVYPLHAVLTIDQVAVGLQIGVRSAERLNLPFLAGMGKQTRRFLWGDVIAFLKGPIR